jgi:transcriptional regulator with XRE-family HTH domain
VNRNPEGLRALGRALAALRSQHPEALSQDGLASASGMDRTHYASIERGEANPTFEKLWGIVAGLGISWESFGRELDKQPRLRQRPITRREMPAPKRAQKQRK